MRFIHRLIRTLVLPNNAGPGDAQIRIGPDVPACMQSTYTAVIMFMPDTWDVGIGAPPIHYYGLRTLLSSGSSVVDYGLLVWDENGVCGWIVLNSIIGRPPDVGTGEIDSVILLGAPGALPHVGGTGVAHGSTQINIGPSAGEATDAFVFLTGLITFSLNGFGTGASMTSDVRCGDVGTTDLVSMPRGLRGTTGKLLTGTVATSGGATAVVTTAQWQAGGGVEPSITARNGRLYMLHVQVVAFPSAAANHVTAIQILKGAQTTTGTVLWRWDIGLVPFVFGQVHSLIGYFKNTSGADVATALSLTNTRVQGGNNTSLIGAAGLPCLVQCYDIGDTSAPLAAIAVSV